MQDDGEFVTVGGSPVPGITLRGVLDGHTKEIARIVWSPTGERIATSGNDCAVRVWRADGALISEMLGETPSYALAWSPDGSTLACGHLRDKFVLWDGASASPHRILPTSEGAQSLAWGPDDRLAVGSGSGLYIWDTAAWRVHSPASRMEDKGRSVYKSFSSLAWSPDGRIAAGAYSPGDVVLHHAASGDAHLLRHNSAPNGVAFSPDGGSIAVAYDDGTVRIWDVGEGREVVVLEGHTDPVTSVTISADGAVLASKAQDNTVRLWRCADWSPLAVLKERSCGRAYGFVTIAFHPTDPARLATLGSADEIVRIWEIDAGLLDREVSLGEAVQYTSAKVVLVGDTGVGKTGLGWRVAHGEFKEHASTHGQQFWVVDKLNARRADGTLCEAVLWDLAGQHLYRSVHAIFLDDVDVALVLFDPTNRQDPLKGVQFWLEQLGAVGERPPTILVGARVDRGSGAVSRGDLELFCEINGVTGGFFSVSAMTGDGLPELLQGLRDQIAWDRMTTTVTTVAFKRIKEYVLGLKSRMEVPGRLVGITELRARLQATDSKWQFSDDEMVRAVKHLQNHGYVSILRRANGEEAILLAPDLLVDLAASIVLVADKHPRELGAISESSLLAGDYPLAELAGLTPTEQTTLVDAAVERFVDHNVCFREALGSDTLLIFPGLIKQKRPLVEETDTVDDISYVVHGRVENVYAALVVLLGYTQAFTRINQWQNQAQYELQHGEICGFRVVEEREGQLEFILYFSILMPEHGREMFRGLFEHFLYQRDVEVRRFPPVECENGHRQERATVVRRVREGKGSVFCDECGVNVSLPVGAFADGSVDDRSPWVRREEAIARLRSTYESYLVRVKSYRRDRAAPRCYVSHALEHAAWAAEFVSDLREAGVVVLAAIDRLTPTDALILATSSAYERSWRKALAAESRIVRKRLGQGSGLVIEAVLDGGHPSTDTDFRDETRYALSLFNVVLRLYGIGPDDPAFMPLRQQLTRQWEDTAALHGAVQYPGSRSARVFLSYAHEDEPFKDALVTTLDGLRRRGVVDDWHDRKIAWGDAWEPTIERALSSCAVAVLLVSPDFLASAYIRDVELPRLLDRQREGGVLLLPIIVRPCDWERTPGLGDLQALPRDRKPLVTFPEENGRRDQVWADIAKAIEARLTDSAG